MLFLRNLYSTQQREFTLTTGSRGVDHNKYHSTFYYSKHIMNMGKKNALAKQRKQRSFKSSLSARHKEMLRQPGVVPKNGSQTASIVRFSRALFLDWPVVQPDLARDHQSQKKDARKFWNVAKKTRKQCFQKLPIATPHEKSCDFVFCRRCSRRITQRFHCFLRSSS